LRKKEKKKEDQDAQKEKDASQTPSSQEERLGMRRARRKQALAGGLARF